VSLLHWYLHCYTAAIVLSAVKGTSICGREPHGYSQGLAKGLAQRKFLSRGLVWDPTHSSSSEMG
jgi:hypothetical protein